ncbi:MAG TPA: hypothetical protein VHC49_16245 [Mycobacteriales bacterium]|nr:hypothetical protein [Mycobacteriales bacterium]
MVSRNSWRWSAPAAVVVAIGAGVGINGALSADASPTLPHRSAEQLLVDLQKAQPVQMSGTVVQHADLGIPALPNVQGESSNLTSLVAGSHTLRVWYGGADKARVALVGTLGESDVIRNGNDVWVWSSQKNQAQHLRLPAHRKQAEPRQLPSELSGLTPRQLAEKILSAVDPSTAVKTDGTVSVAGRDAYQVSISPRTADSKIGSIRIAIDAETSAPLRVEVFARDNDSEPALDAGFTHVDFGSQSASQFRFDPPSGVKVEQIKPQDAKKAAKKAENRHHSDAAQAPKVREVGQGWRSVVIVSGIKDQKSKLQGYMDKLTPVSGTWGSGRLFSSALFDVLLTNDGRVIAGAVSPQVLYDAAGR